MSKKKDKSLTHIVNLVVGDWSHDGHSITETVTVATNVSRVQLYKAYKTGAAKVGLDLEEEVAADFEDNLVQIEQWRKLEAAGLTLESVFNSKTCYELKNARQALAAGLPFHVYVEDYARIWLFIAQLGNPDVQYKVKPVDIATINIGGYGLLSN